PAAPGALAPHRATTLLRRGHPARALTRDPGRTRFLPQQGVEPLPGHLGDRTALERLARGADAIVHLVGIIVEQGPQTFAAVHVEGTGAMLAAARAAGVSRFVHMSAVGGRDEPGATPDHRTKRQAEQMVRARGLSHALLQP